MGELYEFIVKNSKNKKLANDICVYHWNKKLNQSRKSIRMGYFIGKLDAFIDSGREMSENSYVKYGNGLINLIKDDFNFQIGINEFLERLKKEGKLKVCGEFHRIKLYPTEKLIKSN
jgi:hypothetical protein